MQFKESIVGNEQEIFKESKYMINNRNLKIMDIVNSIKKYLKYSTTGRSLLFIFGLVFFFTFFSCQKNERIRKDDRPNILFIMSDDHSYQTISAYDRTYLETPNIDRIAKEGIIFQNSFVSNSICGPSRAVLLTGKHSHINGQINNSVTFDSLQPTFPKLLQKAGYQTALIGKWHLRSEPTGFGYYDRLIGQGDYYNTPFITNGLRTESKGYVTDVITDKSIEWLNNRDTSKPFSLMVHHKAAHRIWMPKTTDFELFDTINFELPETFFDDYTGRVAAHHQKMSIEKDMDLVYDLKMLDQEGEIKTAYRKMFERMISRLDPIQRKEWDAYYNPVIEEFKKRGLKGKALALWKYKRYMQDYLRCIYSLDQNIGRILDYLEVNNLANNTIVIYTSDQGFYMGEHGWFDKRFMYEESLRTPLLIRVPEKYGGTKGAISKMVQNIDYAPTFLDFAGVDIPEEIQGKSLKPMLTGENESRWRDAIYYHYYEYPNEHMVVRHYGIRTDRYKLIHFYDEIYDGWELYDLENDPGEMLNVYNDKNYEVIRSELTDRLAELQIEYKDLDRSTY